MSEYRTKVLQEEINDDDNNDDEEREEKKEEEMNKTKQQRTKSINTNERPRKTMERFHENSNESSADADPRNALETTETNSLKIQREILNAEELYHNELTTKCYQLKLHRTMDGDFGKVIRNFHESEIVQPVVDRIKLIEDQWRTLDLWEILQSVNPRRIMEFGRDELFRKDSTSLGNNEDMIFRRSIVLCSMFEDLMRTLGLKVGDTHDIEHDICDVVGQLLMKVEKQDMSGLLNCMQSAIVNMKVEDSKPNGDKLRTLLITKKKYNGLNLACILLEQMILDNKDNNVSWMRIVCAQFIDLVVQLIIEHGYREDVHETLTNLLKMESEWSVADVYNLTKNGLLIFHGNQEKCHRYLTIIRNFALRPSLNICPTKRKKAVELKDVLYCRNENKWRCLKEVVSGEETEKSVDQVIHELKEWEITQTEKYTIQKIISNSQAMLKKYKYFRIFRRYLVRRELDRIRKSKQKYDVDVVSSCLAVTSMSLHTCKKYWPLNTQLVSYCLLVAQNKEGRLLEILTGEGKSCVIAMVAATYALLGRTVDIVTSSPMLSQRDADEWREFYSLMELEVGCNVEDNTKEDTTCYECPIVYGTVETFARDILKTEFFLQDVRKGRKCDIVIVDEVDSMLIDQGVQCTYLSHDVASIGMRHFHPILALIWMHVSRLLSVIYKEETVFYSTEPEDILVALSRLSGEIDLLQILRLAEEMVEEVEGIKKGFTDEYLSKDIEGQRKMLSKVDVLNFFKFARNILHLDINIYSDVNNFFQRNDKSRISVIKRTDIYPSDELVSVFLHGDIIKDRLTKMMTDSIMSDENETKIDLPIYLRDHCVSRLRCWIDNAFLAKEMQPGREYITDGGAIYPVDFKSTGVIETNKKWCDGLQQFLEMKHGLSPSPLSLITNFLSNIDFFERYGSNIIGVSGTLGNDAEKKFMSDMFVVEFATIPTSKRRKLCDLDGMILENKNNEWLTAISSKVESAVASQRAVLVICEDIATAKNIDNHISYENGEAKFFLHTQSDGTDGRRMKKEMKPGDVVITTNLGARGTDFVTDDVVNKNGGLFVLVTFIPLNDRVEKQAFGRTGRKGATGSCQIIINRESMPEWARQCETVDEAKCLRDSIEMHRLENMTEVNLMRDKQQLFREYCELKMKLNTSSSSDSDDLKIQDDILDETWAKWIQDVETRAPKWDKADLIEELRQNIETYFDRAKQFESDNIYHIMKFGSVRLMKKDFEGASKFYDRVINMDPGWSAFAHYNRSYCTIHMKGDGYIRRAIDDLREALCKLKTYKQNSLCSDMQNVRYKSFSYYPLFVRSTSFYTMMECQLFVHIDSQIIETIEKLEMIDAMKGEVTTVRQDILDLIPGADCGTKGMLQEYRQLGLLFTYNIDVEPQFCYRSQIASSLAMLESVGHIILLGFFNNILAKGLSIELKDAIDAACSVKASSDESLGWMSRCVSRAIINGINSNNFMSDVSSLVPTKQIGLESSHKMTKETSQFTHFANSQATYVLELLDSSKQERNNLMSCQRDETILHMTDVTMEALKEKIEQTIREKIKPGRQEKFVPGDLHEQLCCLYRNVTSPSRSDLEQFVDCIRDLATFSANPSQLSYVDFQIYELEAIANVLMSKSRNDNITATDLVRPYTSKITKASAEIEIGIVITKFSEFLSGMINMFSMKKGVDGHVRGDVQILEATNKVLTSAWSDIIRGMLLYRIRRSVVLDIQWKTEELFHSKYVFARYFYFNEIADTLHFKPLPDLSNRLGEYNNQIMSSRGPHVRTKIDAQVISKRVGRNIIILDVDKEPILTISSRDIRDSIELIYNPPCPAYPGGHFDAHVGGNVTVAKFPTKDNEDYDLLNSAIKVSVDDESDYKYHISQGTVKTYIDEHPSEAGRLISIDAYSYQLKRGRALLRLEMNHPTRQMNQGEHVGLDSSLHFSCIEQSLKSENVSPLAKVLEKYESESRYKTEAVTSSVPRDACKLFLFSGSSVEAEVYRRLIVERINDGDITTALKLCCIGHQIPLVRNDSKQPISDVQPLRYTFDQMLKTESYEQEIYEFLWICDELYKVLEPHGLMNIEQRELLREWISTRQYANTEDPDVALMIKKCSEPKKEEEERKWQEAKKIKEKKME